MKNIIILFCIFLNCSISHAEKDQDYFASVGIEAHTCSDVPEGVECITYFDSLTNSLFKDGWSGGFGNFHLDYYDALVGEQHLYCAILSDHVHKYENAPKFYDQGMQLLDKYTSDYAIRDINSYRTLRNRNPITEKLPLFHQSWLINNKDVLKGILFENISSIFRDIDVITTKDFYKKEIQEKFNSIYDDKCKPLLKEN